MHARRYAIFGVLAGLGLPASGTLVSAWLRSGSLAPRALWAAHLSDPLVWIMDTAPLVLGALAFVIGRQHDALSHQHEAGIRAERARRDAFERAAADVARRSRSLLSTVATFTASTAETAVSVRETASTMTSLVKTATAAALSAESVVGLALKSDRAAEEGTATAEASSAALAELAAEVRGISRRVAGLNARMRDLFELAVAVDREPARAHEVTAQVRAILGEVHREMRATVEAAEAGSVRAEEGGRVVHRAGETIRALARALADSSAAGRQIAGVAQQQEAAFHQVMNAMNEIYVATEETAACTREVAEEAQSLADLSGRLKGAVRQESAG
jgi:methyl-accepting chemotaxis protein